jgi:TatD DNase family protein
MDLESWRVLCALAAGNPLVVPSFGIHPAQAGAAATLLRDTAAAPAFQAELEAALAETPLVGEIGLDTVWFADTPLADQLLVFRFLFGRAAAMGKAAVIHTKGAEALVADEIERLGHGKAVIHWYSGPEPEFRRLVGLGCWFTCGPETGRSAILADFCRRIPADRLLAETDNPGGEPWLGGSDSSPGLIRRIHADIAAARGMKLEAVRRLVLENSLDLLGLA